MQKTVPTKLYVVSIVPRQGQKDQKRLGEFLRLARNTREETRTKARDEKIVL